MRDSPYHRYWRIIGLRKPMKMTLKRRMKINRTILNPIIMQLPLALMDSGECISSQVVMSTQISSRRVKTSI